MIEPAFSSLRRLLATIGNMEGVHGMFIDFIECPKQFAGVLDVAGKNKLFSLIVENLDVAKQVLEENRKIKGGVINIYPLETIQMLDQK